MDNGIPTQVGRYTVDRLLGTGAMGFVYLGHDPVLDRAVAIKTLRDMGLDEDALARFVERFKNEARAAAQLQHPSIVQVYDVGEDERAGPYLVFEYVPGSTLKQIVRDRGPLDPASVVRLAEQVAEALDAAHRHDIIHRDLKPENLLVTADGRAKLADFGVARVPNAALTREGQFLGTPCYAAPETLREGQYGPQSDLFSFGAVLYEAITGMRAFAGHDAVEVASKVIHGRPPRAADVAKGDGVPRGVDTELMRALSKDPSARHRTAGELAGALRAAYVSAGVLPAEGAATQPELGRQPAKAGGRRAGEDGRGRAAARLVLPAVLVVGVGAGVAAVAVLAGGSPPAVDARTPSAASDGPSAVPPGSGSTAQEPGPTPDVSAAAAGDAGQASDAGDSGAALVLRSGDGGGETGDAAAGALKEMTPHDREEAAKDALSRAREHLRAKRWDAARRALDEARRYDPRNPDIERLQRRLP